MGWRTPHLESVAADLKGAGVDVRAIGQDLLIEEVYDSVIGLAGEPTTNAGWMELIDTIETYTDRLAGVEVASAA